MKQYLDAILKEFGTDILRHSTSNNEIYITSKQESTAKLCDYLYNHAPLVLIFATDERSKSGHFFIHYVFSFDKDNFFVIIRSGVQEKFQSISRRIPAASWYEREIQDMFGLVPEGHPDPRRLVMFEDWPDGIFPLRKDFNLMTKVPRVSGEYVYRRVDGEGVYEIPVGPVHAGVIEPGHFRFSVAGEPILNLEIRHFYTHKGVEKMFETLQPDTAVFLAERVSGDNSVAHAVAFCQAVEKIAGIEIPDRAKYIRTVLLELERIYNHVGDIAGISTDVGYYAGAAHANRLKEDMLQLNEALTGSRLLRGMNTIGGICREIGDMNAFIVSKLSILQQNFSDLMGLLKETPSVMDRMETTGHINTDIAYGLHVVGPAARASGIGRDMRSDYPYAAYNELDFKVQMQDAGDVLARTEVRAQEIRESISLVEQAIRSLPEGDIRVDAGNINSGFALGYTEAPRGETMYWVRIEDGRIDRCKVRDPSFCNWLAIEHAVMDNIVPDFPLINKSLSLSYSGNDM